MHDATRRPDFGLCDACRHQHLVANTRGSVFSRCERHRHDARFPKYPRVPVVACSGFEREATSPCGDS